MNTMNRWDARDGRSIEHSVCSTLVGSAGAMPDSRAFHPTPTRSTPTGEDREVIEHLTAARADSATGVPSNGRGLARHVGGDDPRDHQFEADDERPSAAHASRDLFADLGVQDLMRLWLNLPVRRLSAKLAREVQVSISETALTVVTCISVLSAVTALVIRLFVIHLSDERARLWGWLQLLTYGLTFLAIAYLIWRRRRGTLTAAAFNWTLAIPAALGGLMWGVLPIVVGSDSDGAFNAAALIGLVIALVGFFWTFGHWVLSLVYTSTLLASLVASFRILGRPEWLTMAIVYPLFVGALLVVSMFATLGLARARYQMLLASERDQLVGLLMQDYERGGHDWVWVVDDALCFTHVPPRMAIAAANDGRARVGGSLRDLLADNPQVLADIDAQRPFQATIQLGADGTAGEMRLWGRPRLLRGSADGYHGVGSDVAATRRAREAEHASERLDATVSMTTGLAHDFNNLLATVLSSVELVTFDGGLSPGSKAHLQQAIDACLRTRGLTSDLVVAAGHDASHEAQPFEVRSVVDQVVADLAPVYPAVDIRLQAPERAWVCADQSKFARAVRNLVENACLATSDVQLSAGGAAIATDWKWVDITVGESVADGQDTVTLRIADSGPGVPVDDRARLFEPYFSTRRGKGGSGLGLAVAHGFAVQAGGTLLLEPSTKGAIFRLDLPAHSGGAVAKVPRTADTCRGAALPRSSAHVLVVEDDHSVARNLATALRTMGAKVSVAHSVGEAFARFLGRANTIDCVLSDLVLPDGEGYQVVAGFRERVPGLPAVYVSGFCRTLPETVAEGLRCPFVAKPFALAELVDAMMLAGVSFRDHPVAAPVGQPALVNNPVAC